MDREQVNSGLIESVGYDKSSSILEVEFNKSGDVWQYYDVPIEVYESMLINSSIGRFFLNNIKGKYKAIKQ